MGLIWSVLDQNAFAPKPKWSTDDIPDLQGRIFIVTGASSGLGKETAVALLAHGAKVYLACRDKEKTEKVIRELHNATGNSAIFLQVDFANLASIKHAAEEFQRKEKYLNVLFNNAGVMAAPLSELTDDGYDLQFGVNVLGHFYFTQLLMPYLKAGAAQSPDHVARVINTSSQNHVLGQINFDSLKDGPVRRKMSPGALYAQATFARIVYSYELARRQSNDGIISIALHPGSLTTDIGRYINPTVRRVIHALSRTPKEGALTQLWGGTAPEAAALNGAYLIPWARIGKSHQGTDSETLGKELWKWLDDQIQQFEGNAAVPT